MASLFQQQFSAKDVATASGITPSTLQNWVKRSVILGHKQIAGGGTPGRHRRFSWFNVVEIAIAAELVKAGVSDLSQAFARAQVIAHTGDEVAIWNRDHKQAPSGRLPSLPFHFTHGLTFLVVSEDESSVVVSQDGNVNLAALPPRYTNTPTFVVVNVTAVFKQICSRLGFDYRQILEEAYPNYGVTKS